MSGISKFTKLVDEQDARNIKITHAQRLIHKLEAIKVCDPACGSGAYLLGMLQEIHALQVLLDTAAHRDTARDDYERKLKIIENCLYGVDIDAFAINIAWLRLWLSLVIDDPRNPLDDPNADVSLPNLDVKIEVGDSLLAPVPSDLMKDTRGQFALVKPFIEKYINEKSEYLRCAPEKKAQLRKEMASTKNEIRAFFKTEPPVGSLDWAIEFIEVFIDENGVWRGGFDVVLANPPYGLKLDDSVRNHYFDRRTEGAQSKDSYGIFIAQGIRLLKPGGTLCYIVSDTWRTIRSHLPLRKRLLTQTTVSHFIDLPSWVFDATVNTCILTLRKGAPTEEHQVIAADLRALPRGDWDTLIKNLNAIAYHGPDLQTLTFARYTYPQSLIATYENCSFFIASPKLYRLMSDPRFQKLGDIADVKVGLQTGDNEYYLRKRPGVRGNYQILDESKLLTEEEIANLSEDEKRNGVDPAKYGGRHFVPYDKGGESDADEGWLPNYYVPTGYFIDWSRDAVHRLRTATVADVKRRKGEKIKPGDEERIASRFQNSEFYFRKGITFSYTGFYAPNFRLSSGAVFDVGGSSCFWDSNVAPEFLLALLASCINKFVAKNFVDHTVNFQVDEFKELLVNLNIEDSNKHRLITLVASIMAQQRKVPNYPYHLHEQREIDALVYEMYGLDEHDIREVTLWYCRRYPALAKAQGVLAEAREKYADYLAWCDFILSKPPDYWASDPLLKLISQGESDHLEFKQSLEYVDPTTLDPNIPNDQKARVLSEKQRAVLHSALKSICAFLNSPDGGTLLIGVHDKGEIVGIKPDLDIESHN
ncbi:MAG TPA: N-6 DNA methylase [Fimbriimonadales bacterium]|nr:N-6 DNA methylase [Fimbriimonadales bacterium]